MFEDTSIKKVDMVEMRNHRFISTKKILAETRNWYAEIGRKK